MVSSRTALTALAATALLVACHQTPATTPTPGSGATAAPAPTPAPGQPGPGGGRGGPRPSPDSLIKLRAGVLKTVAASIAGRENEPAEVVFKNIQVLKGKTAAEVLTTMENYSNALTAQCTTCHVAGSWADESRQNKSRARVMQTMVNAINADHIPKMQMSGAAQVTCMTCHRGLRTPNQAIDAGLQKLNEAAKAGG
ncbi:MAG: photosynthetic reaction center cytochrome c subunit [Gemmatimonadetes bacterium]|nr:photosynthetic reaction center cytochrome c subunit [Gemmatimonadota bacterium]